MIKPPINPSHDLSGETRGKILCFPIVIPVRNANMSFIQMTAKIAITKGIFNCKDCCCIRFKSISGSEIYKDPNSEKDKFLTGVLFIENTVTENKVTNKASNGRKAREAPKPRLIRDIETIMKKVLITIHSFVVCAFSFLLIASHSRSAK